MTEKKMQVDATSARRQANHLNRLKEGNGRRLPVDLDADRNMKLKRLVEMGFGENLVDVIRKAIDGAYVQMLNGDLNQSNDLDKRIEQKSET